MTTRTMYDSTTVSDVPETATMIAGYVDGNYRTVDALHERFPKAKIVTVTVLGTPGANVCDTEPGNIGIAAAARWAAGEVAAGRHPTLYCMASQWPQVKAAVKANGVTGKVSYWIAQYDGKASIPAGAVAKQYASSDVPAGQPGHTSGHKDVSIVASYWPGVDPPPAVRLSPVTRAAVRLATRGLKRRHRQVTPAGRELLLALRAAVNHALNVK